MSQSTRCQAAFSLSLLSAALAASTWCAHAEAQAPPATGSVSGLVIDKSTAQPLSGVRIQVEGDTRFGGVTNERGRYAITGIPAGQVTLTLRRIGYQPTTVTGISLAAGRSVTQDVSMDVVTQVLSGVTVTSSVAKGSVFEALAQQKASPAFLTTVTAEQIQKSADGDGAAVAQRASGVTLQDRKFAVVRGQPERSSTASLNGIKIPSPEPEKRQVPLDMIPSSLIRTMNVVKTFTPDQSGDFSGAIIDIRTRDFPSRRSVAYSTSFGMNTAATGKNVIGAPISGAEWLAVAGGERSIPGLVREAGNFGERQFTQPELNQMIGSFRNVWTPEERRGLPNSSFAFSAGDNRDLFGRQFGYVGALSYSMGQEVRADEYRALIDFGTGTSAANEFRGSAGNISVLWGGLLNFSTFLGGDDVLTFNNSYNRTSDSEARRDRGRDENLGLDNILERSTLSFVERSVRSNQVSGTHRLTGATVLDWTAANSAVTRREPDRADMVYISTLNSQTLEQNPFVILASSQDGARRTFADLTEGAWNASTDLRIELPDAWSSSLKFGALYRYTSRDSEVRQYSINTLRPLAEAEASLAAEQIFDGRHTQGGDATWTLSPLSQSGSYEATDHHAAGYLMANYGLRERIRIIGGARVEFSHVRVVSENFFGHEVPVTRSFTDVLPSLAVNVALSDEQNVRVSAARTLARPEYRELSPMLNRDVLGGQGFRGDTALIRTRINNYDVRWEWYPSPGELFSVAVFAKSHNRPIEKVEVPTSGTSVLSFINAHSARNFGVELELRKNLDFVSGVLSPFSVSGNVTFMSSEIRLGETNAASATNANRPLAGQAPYVVNGGLTYSHPSLGASASLLYNRVGRRIQAAGPKPLPDIFELPRDLLDVAIRAPIRSTLGLKLDAKNVLNSPFELRQGAVTRHRYTAGRVFTMGLSWSPQ